MLPVPEHFLGNHPSFEIFLTSAFYEAEIHCYHFSLSLSPLKRRLKDCFCLRTFFLAYHKKNSQNRALSVPRKRALKMKPLRCRVFHPKTSRKDDAHRVKVEAGVTDLLCNKAKKERRWWSWTHITWRRGPRHCVTSKAGDFDEISPGVVGARSVLTPSSQNCETHMCVLRQTPLHTVPFPYVDFQSRKWLVKRQKNARFFSLYLAQKCPLEQKRFFSTGNWYKWFFSQVITLLSDYFCTSAQNSNSDRFRFCN